LKHINTLILFLLSGYICTGQAPAVNDTIFISDVKNESNLLDKTWFYFDSSNSLSLPEILKNPFERFKTAYSKVRIKPEKVSATLYLKIRITNNTDKETSAYLDPRTYFKKYDLYKAEGESTNIQDSSNFSNYKKITLAAGTTGLFLLKIKPLKTEIGSISPVLINAGSLQEYKNFLTGQN